MTIEGYFIRAQAIDLPALVVESLEESSEAIITLNQLQLFTESEKQTGDKLEPYDSIVYAMDKNKQNPLTGLFNPDFYLTGDFYKGFFVKVEKTSFEVDSNDSKSGFLKARDGDEIFGLNDEHLAQLTTDYIELALMTKIKERL